MAVYRPAGKSDVALGPPHNVRPLEILIPDRGRRHAVMDLPELHGLEPAVAQAIRANFYQLARKVEDMRAALQAMGVPITEEK